MKIYKHVGKRPAVTTFASVLTGIIIMSATAVSASSFDITIEFGGGLSASQQDIFLAAEDVWESYISGYAYDVVNGFSGPTITAAGVDIDDDVFGGNVLGFASPQNYFENNRNGNSDYAYTSTGFMQFDNEDLASLEDNGTLFDVILHEMAHVLGVGTLWDVVGVYTNGSGEYTGEAGLAAYQETCDADATYVPVELDGGSGTSDSHWDETWACGNDALLTGYLNSPTYLSYTTIASLADLGYIVSLPSVSLPAVPLPTSLMLSTSAFGVFGVLARRRSRRAQV